jgi:hypothetical protein
MGGHIGIGKPEKLRFNGADFLRHQPREESRTEYGQRQREEQTSQKFSRGRWHGRAKMNRHFRGCRARCHRQIRTCGLALRCEPDAMGLQ